jgi:hypothetical protein
MENGATLAVRPPSFEVADGLPSGAMARQDKPSAAPVNSIQSGQEKSASSFQYDASRYPVRYRQTEVQGGAQANSAFRYRRKTRKNRRFLAASRLNPRKSRGKAGFFRKKTVISGDFAVFRVAFFRKVS